MTCRAVSRSLAAVLLLAGVVPVWAQAPAPTREPVTADDYSRRRAAALADALGMAGWRSTPGLYAAPGVSRVTLRETEAVLDEVRACTTITLEGADWPECTWSWKRRAAGGKPSEDWLDLHVTVAPDARAARAHLVDVLAANQLPTEILLARYGAAERPGTLGDAAFVVRSPRGDETSVAFVRANLVFRVRGHGALADEAPALAARLDERVLGQSPVTPEDLRSRAREPLRRR